MSIGNIINLQEEVILECLVKSMWGLRFFLLPSWQLNWIGNCIWKFSDLFKGWDLKKNFKCDRHLHKNVLLLYLLGIAMKVWKGIFRNLGYKPSIQPISRDVLCVEVLLQLTELI